MSFTSPLYYLFLALSVTIYFSLAPRWRPYLLIVSSYVFYLSFNPGSVIFILSTTLVSYFCARSMTQASSQGQKKLALGLALAVEIFLLSLTKYWNPVAEASGLLSPIDILIPLGISFYTFQSIGYLFDVYNGTIKAELNFTRYALFLCFFPHLLAGPIEPAQNFLPQLRENKSYDKKAIALGALFIMTGLFKKLVIADRFGPIVKLVFENPGEHKGMGIALATILARYQIYFDFSGYTDIALGSAMMFGFKLTSNFNRPFFSRSIVEYWRRWHISLSSWIRNYIFYPMLTTSVSKIGVSGIVLLTFLILGLWHGATVNFIIYGLIQGVLVIADHKTKSLRLRFYQKSCLNQFPNVLSTLNILITFFILIVPPTIFFRSSHLSEALLLIKNVSIYPWRISDLGFLLHDNLMVNSLMISLSSLVVVELVDWVQKKRFNLAEFVVAKAILFYLVLMLFFIAILGLGIFDSNSMFIYTKF